MLKTQESEKIDDPLISVEFRESGSFFKGFVEEISAFSTPFYGHVGVSRWVVSFATSVARFRICVSRLVLLVHLHGPILDVSDLEVCVCVCMSHR